MDRTRIWDRPMRQGRGNGRRVGLALGIAAVKTAVALCLAAALPARAVIFYSTGDPAYNTNAPGGSLTNSGWQWQGKFGQYLGTPVSPHFFLTAHHLGGATNWPFYYNGATYTCVAYYDDAGSDLRLWKVAERFASYAPLYTNSNEAGKGLVAFGRGVQRGADVIANGTLKGWRWGGYDGVTRWGTNVVAGSATVNGYPTLKAAFNSNGGSNECHLGGKDSGGSVFIQDGGVWRLAGINYTVDGKYSTNHVDFFQAAIFDEGGLYVGDTNSSTYVFDTGKDRPGAFYATRVSERFSWITNTIPAAEFDLDADGLPDEYELQYAGDRTSMDPHANADSDPDDNLAEYIAGTNPTNDLSYFHLTAASVAADTSTVSFVSATGRLYRVQQLVGSLPAQHWTDAAPGPMAGAPTETTWTGATPAVSSGTGAFFRVEAYLP